MKILFYLLVSVACCVAFCFTGGVSPGELGGLVQASASRTVKSVIENVPESVTDESLDTAILDRERAVAEREVQLEIWRRKHTVLGDEVAGLKKRLAERREVLRGASAKLEEAERHNHSEVTFMSRRYPLDAFKLEIDALLDLSEREARQLKMRREAREALGASLLEGEAAVAQAREAVTGVRDRVDLLRARRTQAELENAALELRATASGPTFETGALAGVEQLRSLVEDLEARVAIRRGPRKPSGLGSATRDVSRSRRLRDLGIEARSLARLDDIAGEADRESRGDY